MKLMDRLMRALGRPAQPLSDGSGEADERQKLPPRELLVPLVLLAVGLLFLFISALALGDRHETLRTLQAAAAVLVLQVPVTILALYIVSALAGISYGRLGTAVLKLAAIMIFIEGPAFMGGLLGYPIASRVILLPVVWFLFSYLFELDFTETFYSIVGWVFVSAGINWLIILLTGHLSRVPT